MKKTAQILFFLCFILSTSKIQAQISVSFRTGVNVANYQYHYSSDFPNTLMPNDKLENVALLTVGLPVEIAFKRHFALQTELNFIQKGYKTRYEVIVKGAAAAGNRKLVTNWIEIPVLAKFKFGTKTGVNGGLLFGPSIGYALSGHIKYASISNFTGAVVKDAGIYTLKFPEEQSSIDWGLNLGGDVNYGNIFLDIRYQLGLKDMNTTNFTNNAGSSITTRGLALTVGYRFWTKIKGQKT